MKINSIYNSPKDITIESYLNKCGIQDISEFVLPKGKYIESWLQNDRVINTELLIESINSETPCFIIQDSDVDGICSATIAYQFLRHINVPKKNIYVLFHKGKQHGFKDIYKEVIGCAKNLKKPYFVWCPDAGSNDINECKEIQNCGGNILITDHHDSSYDGSIKMHHAIVINNQIDNDIKNKALCGTGVTYKVVEQYCKKHSDQWYKNLLDLVALANIADVMDMNNYENRTFNYYGLRRIKNPFLKFLCETYIKDEITPKNLAFNVIPKSNAVCRSDNQELKTDVFKAFVGIKDNYKELIRDINKCYSQQRKYVSEKFEEYKNEIDKFYDIYDYGDVILFHNAEASNYTGLIATKLSEYYAKPVIVVYIDEPTKVWRGSCRSPIDFRTILSHSNVMNVCTGHEKAFGVEWNHAACQPLTSYLKKLSLDIEPNISVLCSCTVPELSEDLFIMGHKYRELWGHGIEEPKYHLKEIVINGTDIREVGTNGIRFNYGFISFVKFGLNKTAKAELNVGRDIKMRLEIIGSLGLNEWNGRVDKQVVMERIIRV